jgi:hypothetical protein
MFEHLLYIGCVHVHKFCIYEITQTEDAQMSSVHGCKNEEDQWEKMNIKSNVSIHKRLNVFKTIEIQ